MTRSVAPAALLVVALTVAGCTRTVGGSTSPTSPATDHAGAPSTDPTTPGGSGDGDIAAALAAVPLPAIAAATEQVDNTNPLRPVDEAPLVADGKPQVLYIGAEFCPYCAAERWALVVALSKFGEFSGLETIHSSEGDVPTMSFLHASYTSRFVAFDPIELKGQNREPLEEATDAQLDLFERLGRSSFPFISFGGAAIQSGASVDVVNLVDRTHFEIAERLADSTIDDTDPNSLEGNVNAVAGGFITEICALTGDRADAVCRAFSTTI